MYVEVLDENDNVPLTEQPVYYPSVPENSAAGVSVLQLRAFDRDVSLQEFTYSISSGNAEGYFLINSSSGELVKKKKIIINKFFYFIKRPVKRSLISSFFFSCVT